MTVKEITELVNEGINSLPYDRKPQSLYEPIIYTMSQGGKRIRPVLTLLSYYMFRDDILQALPCAMGLEMYHNYTLLHDDLMDNSDMRRGNMTVHKKWDANTAILSGDSMLVLSYQLVSQCPQEMLQQVIDTFTITALEIGEGQQYDMDFEKRTDVTEEEYIEMIRLKTSVLLACAAKIGAILAGASSEEQNHAYRFGEQLGLAFQLQDDFLDVYGDEKVFGKKIGGDITSNKKTYMLIKALERAEGIDKQQLEYWIEAQEYDRSEKVNAVTEIYTRLGIDTLAKERIDKYFTSALNHLDAISAPAERKAELLSFVQQMMRRER